MERRILLIGIGESGAKSVRAFSLKTQQSNIAATCLSMDTDLSVLQTDTGVQAISLARAERLYETVQELSPAQLAAWFPCDFTDTQNEFLKSLRMDNGAGLWRSKALLHFVRYMADAENKAAFCGILDGFLADYAGEALEIYTVASLAGGTGSALFLPVTLYILQYIRQKVGVKADAKAFLFSPELYADLLSAEQSVKAHANAYAALRELHTVHETVFARTAVGTAPSATRFVLGNAEDDAIGLLFDAEDIRFHTPDAAPFSAVYLLERQAGIRTVGVHTEALGDVLASLCKASKEEPSDRKIVKKSPDALFGSVLLTKVSYPGESIAASIAATRLADTVQSEWLWLHRAVMHLVREEAQVALRSGSPLADTAVRYRRHLLSLTDSLLQEHADGSTLLGKELATAPITVPVDFSADRYLLDARKQIDSYVLGAGAEAFRQLKARITAAFAKPALFGRVRLPLYETATDAKRILTAVYTEAHRAFHAYKDTFTEAIAADAGALSLTENVLHEEGASIHPVAALVRLCTLASSVASELDAAPTDVSYNDDIPGLLDEAYLRVPRGKPKKGKKERYGVTDPERLLRLLDGDLTVRGKSVAEAELFERDLDTVYAAVTAAARACFLRLLADALSAQIHRYTAFLGALADAEADIEAEVGERMRKDSYPIGVYCYVFAAEADRKRAAAAFAQSVADGEEDDLFTPALYRVAENAVQNGTRPAEWFAEATAAATEKLLSSDFYAAHLDKNILEVLLAPDPAVTAPEGGSGLRLRKAFSAAAPSLKCTMLDPGDGTTLRTLTAVQFSEEVRTYLENNRASLGIRGEDARGIVENILYASDESADHIDFSPEIGKNCLYIRKELGNLCLGEIELVNEEARPPIGSAACEKALRMMRTQYTEMWNPYLFRDAENRLPLIRASLQERREQTAVSALLYALSTEQIRTVKDETGTVLRYSYLHDGIESEVLSDGSPALAGDLGKLLQWLRTEGGLIALWGAAAEARLTEDCTSLPSADIGNMRLSEVLEAAERTETLDMLAKWLLPLAETAADGETRTRVLRTGLFTAAALCDSRIQRQDPAYAQMLRHLLQGITDRFGDKAPAEEATALTEALSDMANTLLPSYKEP